MDEKMERVFEAIVREAEYAKGWSRPGKDQFMDPRTGLPYRPMDWIVFAEEYIAQAKLAWVRYTPDENAVAVRMLKAAYLLVAGIMTNFSDAQIDFIGGKSSNKFPIHEPGIAGKIKAERDA